MWPLGFGALRCQRGDLLLTFAMEIAEMQILAGRSFCFEHPKNASSWEHPSVARVAQMPGVQKVTFDQCLFGACTKCTQTPVQRETKDPGP